MSRQICKLILDNGVWGLSESIRQALTYPDMHQNAIPEKIRLTLLDRLAKIDVAAYTGEDMPVGGLAGILVEMEQYEGMVSEDVWKVFVRPRLAETGEEDKTKRET